MCYLCIRARKNHYKAQALKEQQRKEWNMSLAKIQNELKTMANKMNSFNRKYNVNKLDEMYNYNPSLWKTELDIGDCKSSCKSLLKQLQVIDNYVTSKNEPDTSKYTDKRGEV